MSLFTAMESCSHLKVIGGNNTHVSETVAAFPSLELFILTDDPRTGTGSLHGGWGAL